jgi:arabinofuranosyltransferase
VSTVAAGIYLIRPDGLLYVAATLALLVLAWPGQRGRALLARLAAGAPLLMVVIHMLWRHSFYGEWLPNTFYAKSNGWWWECGWRYAASFFLEYGLVVWLLAALAALVVWARRSGFPRLGKTEGGLFQGLEKLLTASAPSLMRGVAVATVLAHVLYYTLIIGGDHFEYRVYSHVVPLLWVSLLWAVNVLMVRRWTAVLALLLALGISWPLPWVHWAKTCELDRRESTRETTEIRHGFRFKTRHYVKLFDDCQTWLIAHFACLRHQGHKMFLLEQLADHPTRAEGSRISGAGFPIMATKTVGYTGWVLPHVCILDQHGLNDYVIARAPLEPQRFRIMAHEHLPPPGYEASFGVNVVLSNRTFVVKPRAAPLTAEDIRRIEAHWFRWLQAPMNTPPPAARPLAAG